MTGKEQRNVIENVQIIATVIIDKSLKPVNSIRVGVFLDKFFAVCLQERPELN